MITDELEALLSVLLLGGMLGFLLGFALGWHGNRVYAGLVVPRELAPKVAHIVGAVWRRLRGKTTQVSRDETPVAASEAVAAHQAPAAVNANSTGGGDA